MTGSPCPNLMVADHVSRKFVLLEREAGWWTQTVSAGSKEEMDLKLASMGLETDWDGYDWNDLGWSKYQHRVWRVS